MYLILNKSINIFSVFCEYIYKLIPTYIYSYMVYNPNVYKWIDSMRNNTESNKNYDSLNNFEYTKPKTYYNFANEEIKLDSHFVSDKTHIFKIPIYGDLIDKVYLSFSLPILVPNEKSSWVAWKNYIGIFCIDNIDIRINDIVIERLTHDSIYSQFKTRTSSSHKSVLNNLVGACFTDIQLRKNAKQKTDFIIPLHLFFSKVSYNALPINRNNEITMSVTLKPNDQLYISSNALPPKNSISIKPTLNIGYVYLSKDEFAQMSTTKLNYNIEKIDGFTVNLNNKSTSMNLTAFVQDTMMPKLINVLDSLPNCYQDTFSYFQYYSQYVYYTYPQYSAFYNSNFLNIVKNESPEVYSFNSRELNMFSSLHDIHIHYDDIWGYNTNIYYQSIKEYINSIEYITGNSYEWFINSFLLIDKNIDFNDVLFNSADHSSSKYIDSWYNSFYITLDDYSSHVTVDVFISSVLDHLDGTYNSLILHKHSLISIEKQSICDEWNSLTDNSYEYVNVPYIQIYNSNLEKTINEMEVIKSEYQSLKSDIEFEQLPPLSQYIKSYMNELEMYLTDKDGRLKKDKYYKSDLNIFSFNNIIYINSQNSEQYPVGNYSSNCFQYYFETPNCGYWKSINDGFQSITPHSNIHKYRSSLERVLSNSTFFYNSIPFTYFVSENMNINIKENILPYSEFIIDEATINTTDYNNAIDIIDGLNLIVLGREQNNTFDFQDIKDDINQNITNTIHDVIYNRYTTFYSKAIQPQIVKSLDSLEYGTRYVYTITNSIIPNSFIDYYNDTILTLLQYKNDGWNSNSLLSQIDDFIPIIDIFENLYDLFIEISAKLASIIEINSQYADNSEIIYKLSRKLLETESDSFQNFIFKNEFHSSGNIDFETTNITINSCIGYVKYNLNKLWLKQFGVIKKRYGNNNEILNKHKDRYFEHIRNKPYKLKDYLNESMNLNLIDIYEELLVLDPDGVGENIVIDSRHNESKYIYFGIMDQLNIQRRKIIFYDTIGYEIKEMTTRYLSNVSYPIRIDNMNTASDVYNNLLKNIDLSINQNSQLLYDSSLLHQSILSVHGKIETVNNNIYDLNQKYHMLNVLEDQYEINAYYQTFKYNNFSIFGTIKDAIDKHLYELNESRLLYDRYEEGVDNMNEIKNKIDGMNINYNINKISTSLIKYELNTGKLLSLPIKYILFGTKNNQIIDSVRNIKNITISFEQENIEIAGELLYNIKPYLYSSVLIDGVYCLPLCLNTDSLFPSGSLSFSKNVSVKIELMSYNYTDTELHVDVIYYDQLTL